MQTNLNTKVSFLFLRLDKDPAGGPSKYVATALGKAIVSAAVPPDEGITLYHELDKARKGGLLLENDLHLLYQASRSDC